MLNTTFLFFKYLKEILDISFKWWAAALTIMSAIISFNIPPDNIPLWAFSLTIFLLFFLFFLSLSCVIKSYNWYSKRFDIKLVSLQQPNSINNKGNFTLFAQDNILEIDRVFSVFRKRNEYISLMCVVKVDQRIPNSNNYNCIPIWLSSADTADWNKGSISGDSLSFSPFLTGSDLVSKTWTIE